MAILLPIFTPPKTSEGTAKDAEAQRDPESRDPNPPPAAEIIAGSEFRTAKRLNIIERTGRLPRF